MRDWLYPYYCGAGSRARMRYEEGAKRWQTRVFRRPRSVLIGMATLTVAIAIAARHDLWAFVAGMILGGLITGFITLRESPPAYIEQWRTGWEGERRTARALAPLRRSGCALLHDLPDRDSNGAVANSNIDHVVVAPAGVFLLDSKWLGGEVTIVGETVHVQRRDIDDSYEQPRLARQMKARAARLQEDIASSGVRYVRPVVVFWGGFDPGLVDRAGVTFIDGNELMAWLSTQRQKLTAEHVAGIAAFVEHQRPPETRPRWTRALELVGGRDRARTAWAQGSAS
jgi:Nuclease-related domain